MRIIHVSDCFLPMLGGIETQVSQLATKQAEAGNSVMVLTCADGDSRVDAQLPFVVRRSVWPNPLGAPVDARAPKRFLEAIRAWKPEVVHLHMGELTPVVQALLWQLRDGEYPVVVTVHSVWSQQLTIPIYRQLAKVGNLLGSPIAWTGVSHLVAGLVGQVVGSDNVQVLPNGVDSSRWRIAPVAHDGLVAVTASRFAPRKRIPELLEILRGVVEGNPTTKFKAILAGDGPGKKWADEFVRRHGLEESVVLPGRLTTEQLVSLYSQSDVFLSPSILEAASIAGAEAQAAGLAILARSQSGLGERITAKEGAVADLDKDFARQLSAWVRNPDSVRPMQQHNRNTLCPLDWSRILPRANEVYAWAIKRREDWRVP